MNQLQKMFNHPEFGKLQVITEGDKDLFNLNQVAFALGYTRPNSNGVVYLRHDRVEKVLAKLDIATCDRGGHRYIDESGLYDFVFEAGTERSREYRKWVTGDVLPSIRKTGSFSQTKSQAELIAMMAQDNVEKERRLAAVEEKQDNIVSILSLSVIDWRNQVNRIINAIVMKMGGGDYYREIRNESYALLESRGACNLDIRLQNRHSKMSLKGSSKSAISKVTKLDVIAEDKKLISVYVTVIKDLAVKYQLNLSNYQLNETAGV